MNGVEFEHLLREIYGKVERAAGEFIGLKERVERLDQELTQVQEEVQGVRRRMERHVGIAVGLSLLSTMIGFFTLFFRQ